MFGVMLGGNFMTVYAAEADHAHCICGGGVASGEHTTHSDAIFSPYSGGDVTYDENGTAYLYLESDIVHGSNSNNSVDSGGIFLSTMVKPSICVSTGTRFKMTTVPIM